MTRSNYSPYHVMVVASADGASFYGPFATRPRAVFWCNKHRLNHEAFILDWAEFAQNMLDFGPATVHLPETFNAAHS